ncbi:MAG: alkaline phosphatase family protein [Candidatus Korobacteraceae bacterium]
MKYLLSFLLIVSALVVPAVAQPSSHVFVVMLENRSDSEAMKYMPYLSGLANQYSRSLEAYSPSHGSFLAYLELTTGVAPKNGSADNGNCNGDGCTNPYTKDNLVRELAKRGKTWRGYFQSLPYQGYMGSQDGEYVRRHNPFPSLSDVFNSYDQQQNMVPWTNNFALDLAADNVANYTWLVPDLTHDGHDPGDDTQTALHNADVYLSQQLPLLLHSKYFQPGGDGVLLVTFDESDLDGDNSCSEQQKQGCGGHIFFALIGPGVRRQYQSSTHMMQNDMLRGTCDMLGISPCPGDGASVPGLAEFLAGVTVTITSPYDYYPDSGPYTNLQATATSTNGAINAWAVYVDGVLYKKYPGSSSLQAWVPTPLGLHIIGVNAWDIKGAVGVSEVHVTRTY